MLTITTIVAALALGTCEPSPACPGDFNRDRTVNIDDLLRVINDDCGMDALLLVLNEWGPCDMTRYACNNPALFEQIRFGPHTSLTTIVELGDSTSDDWGNPGTQYQSERRWAAHQRFGHTPATQFTRNVSGIAWGLHAAIAEPEDSIVPDSFLPPGMGALEGAPTFSRARSFKRTHAFGAQGLIGKLDPINSLVTYVPAAVDIGNPDYANGTMQGGKSIINCNVANGGGLHIQVMAATDPDSDASAFVQVYGMADLATIPAVGSGTMLLEQEIFGGAETLAAANGTVRMWTSGVLPNLSGTDRFYVVLVTSMTSNGTKQVQLLGVRFISDDFTGVAYEQLSTAGFAFFNNAGVQKSILENRPDCGPVLAAMDPAIVELRYLLNDTGTAAQIGQACRDLIAWVRTYAPNAGICIKVGTDKESPPSDWDEYVDALFEVYGETTDCEFIDQREILLKNTGWGTGSERAYYLASEPAPNGLHHSPLGARLFAELEFQEIRNNLVAPAATTFERHPDSTATDYGDVRIVDAGFADTNFNANAFTEVGFAAGGPLKLRSINEVDLNSVPAGSEIVALSSSWGFHVSTASANALAYSVFGSLLDFAEAQATWNNRLTATAWPAPGGNITGTAIFTGNLPTATGPLVWSGANFDAYIQSVIDAPSDRWARIIGKRDTESGTDGFIGLRSREHTTLSERPVFAFQYVPPDLVAPVLDITSHGSSVSTSEDSLLVEGTFWDNATAPGDASFSVLLDDADVTVNLVVNPDGTWEITLDLSGVSPGATVLFRIGVEDEAANAAATLDLEISKALIDVQITSPTDQSTYETTAATVMIGGTTIGFQEAGTITNDQNPSEARDISPDMNGDWITGPHDLIGIGVPNVFTAIIDGGAAEDIITITRIAATGSVPAGSMSMMGLGR